MSDINTIALSPAKLFQVASASHAAATATQTAGARQTVYITGITISASGVIAAPVSVTVKDGTTVIDQIELAASVAAAPLTPLRINYARPLQCSVGNSAVASLPDLGAGITGTISLHTFLSQE